LRTVQSTEYRVKDSKKLKVKSKNRETKTENFSMIQVLNGATYSLNERPPFWSNESALVMDRFDLRNAPIVDFPLIEDFEVRLEIDTGRGAIFGYQLYFFSVARGYVASFPWHNVDHIFIREDLRIPLGGFVQPFQEYEQSWDIVIAEKDDLVYILQGNFDDDGYHNWFKVYKTQYLEEWQKAIQACREAFLN
jgi:hypothetical protein